MPLPKAIMDKESRARKNSEQTGKSSSQIKAEENAFFGLKDLLDSRGLTIAAYNNLLKMFSGNTTMAIDWIKSQPLKKPDGDKGNNTEPSKPTPTATPSTPPAANPSLPPIKPIEGKEPAPVLSEMEKFRQLLARKGLTSKDYDLLKTYYGNIKDAQDAVKTKNSWQLDDLIEKIEKDIRQAQMDDILWREEKDALVYEDMENGWKPDTPWVPLERLREKNDQNSDNVIEKAQDDFAMQLLLPEEERYLDSKKLLLRNETMRDKFSDYKQLYENNIGNGIVDVQGYIMKILLSKLEELRGQWYRLAVKLEQDM